MPARKDTAKDIKLLCLSSGLSLAYFSFSPSLLPARCQEGFQGILSDLEGLEQRFQSPANPAAPITQRLSALEQRLFGCPRPGSMVERMQSIKYAASQMPAQSQQYPQAQNPQYPQAQNPQYPQAQNPQYPQAQNQAQNPHPVPPAAGQGWMPSSAAGTGSPASNPYPPQNPQPGQGQVPGTPGALPAQLGNGWMPQQAPGFNQGLGNSSGIGSEQNSGSQDLPRQAAATPLPLFKGSKGELKANFAPDALPLQNAFPPNLLRMEPDNTALIARPDYYNEVLKASKGRAIRFKTMPVPVFVQPYLDRGFVACVHKALEAWEFRTGGAVKFTQAATPGQARIQVVWKHMGGKKETNGCLLGAHTILKVKSNGGGNLSFMSVGAVPVPIYMPRLGGPKYTVPPQVMEVNLDLINTKEPSVKYLCLQNIVAHEIGHALGLLGHSPNQADIMYPVTDEYSRISQRDLNTLLKLYKQKCDLPL